MSTPDPLSAEIEAARRAILRQSGELHAPHEIATEFAAESAEVAADLLRRGDPASAIQSLVRCASLVEIATRGGRAA